MSFLKLWICCLLGLLTACGGGGGSAGVPTGSASPSNFIVNAPSTLTLPIGQSANYAITGGKAPYAVTTSAPDVAKVLVNGSELLIAALKKGTTNVVVSPSGGGASYSISVEVIESSQALQVQAPDAISLIPSNVVEYSISGGSPPYRATVGNVNVAAVSIQSGMLKIQALSIGITAVQVFDANNNKVEKSVSVLNSIGPVLFSTAPSSLTMVAGSNNTFSVGGGLPPYTATSSNSTVMNVGVSGNTLTVSAYSEGLADLILKDAAGTSVSISGTVPPSSVVPLFTNAPATLTLQSTGGARDFVIGGGKAPYTAQSGNPASVRVSVTGTVLAVTPASDGTASVTVTDATGAQKTFNVTVVSGGSSTTALFTTAPTTLSISPNSTLTFAIGGGTAPYAAATSNQQVVNASVAGTQLTLAAPSGATGAANVVITDASGGKITVVVTASSAATTTLSLSASILSLPVNTPGSVRIIGGAPPYTVTSAIPSALSVSPSTLTTAGEFTLTPLLLSVLDVTVVDSAGVSAKVNVTITAGTLGIRMAPSNLTISENFANQTINLTLVGQSAGDYRIFSSDVSRIQVVTPVRSDGVIELTTAGSAALGVASDTDVTITVVDSQNRIATSVITVRNN